MKRFSFNISRKQLKKIPQKSVVIWLVLGLIFIYSAAQLLLSVYRTPEDTRECELCVDEVRLTDTYSVSGARMRLEILSDGQTYYLWYPKSHYKEYSEILENELLSGEITSVTATVSEDVSLRDFIQGNKRIVDLRSGSSVYYDIETEKIALRELRISALVALFLSLAVWVIDTGYIMLIYGKVSYRKEPRC